MSNENGLKISEQVIHQIRKGEIKIIPRWRWVFLSVMLVIGVIGISISLIFLVSLIAFSLRSHGPAGSVRFQQLLASFPWWAPILALIGFWGATKIVRHYDFTYKKNFRLIIFLFVLGIISAGFIVDYSGLDLWLIRHGARRGFYEHRENRFFMKNNNNLWR